MVSVEVVSDKHVRLGGVSVVSVEVVLKSYQTRTVSVSVVSVKAGSDKHVR